MKRLLAFTRAVAPSINECELTHVARERIDVVRASEQHERYEDALRALGCEVRRLAPEPDLPDSVFVEDAAVIVDECAVITRPGAESRRREVVSVTEALRPHRALNAIVAPGTLDGGDVLRAGRRVFVGLSSRTNAEGIRQLTALLGPHGYDVSTVAMRDCLHLKTAASALGDALVLLDPQCVEHESFDGLERIEVDASERFAANVLCIGRAVLVPAAASRTATLLESRGFTVVPVDASELAKAEGGLTCCSLILHA